MRLNTKRENWKMFEGYLLYLNAGVLFGLMALFYFFCLEVGFYLGNWINESNKKTVRSQIVTIQTSVLGLLALILGFTFSMSINRFETRKQLLVEEANAIGTSYLRAEMFQEPYQSDMQNLLRKYVDQKIAYRNIGFDVEKIQKVLKESESMQKEIWMKGIEISHNDTRSPLVGLLLESLNQLIDLHASRIQSIVNRLPDLILYLIFLIAGLGLALTGYISGLDRARSITSMILLVILFSAVVLVIIDLDRPGRGFIQENHISLINLRDTLNK